MKNRKKFGRKLTLNKETIQRLNQDDREKVVGGRTAYPNCGITNEYMPCPCEYPITPPLTWLCPTGVIECFTNIVHCPPK